jgi:hypothetical protein
MKKMESFSKWLKAEALRQADETIYARVTCKESSEWIWCQHSDMGPPGVTLEGVRPSILPTT